MVTHDMKRTGRHDLAQIPKVLYPAAAPPRLGTSNMQVAPAGVVEEERARRAAAARAHAEELGALHSRPPAAWPPALRSLVAQREAAAAEAAAASVRLELSSEVLRVRFSGMIMDD